MLLGANALIDGHLADFIRASKTGTLVAALGTADAVVPEDPPPEWVAPASSSRYWFSVVCPFDVDTRRYRPTLLFIFTVPMHAPDP